MCVWERDLYAFNMFRLLDLFFVLFPSSSFTNFLSPNPYNLLTMIQIKYYLYIFMYSILVRVDFEALPTDNFKSQYI